MNLKHHFKLFANCIPVRGAKRSTICDLQIGSYIFIDNWIVDILLDDFNLDIQSVLDKHPELSVKIIGEVYDRLITLGLGHYCTNVSNFPPLSKRFELPYLIQDCILEVSDHTFESIDNICTSLAQLGCQAIELRSYKEFELKKIGIILKKLSGTRIRTADLYIKTSEETSVENCRKLVGEYPILGSFIIHSYHTTSHEKLGLTDIVFTKQQLCSADCCGNISQNSFRINLPFYLQSLKGNSCLYKKLSITEDGSIKNCPSLNKVYGKVADGSNIAQVVSKRDFQEIWHISKDQVEVCRDCEFRYICQDCRAFIENPKAKPLKCSYNPYTMSFNS